MPGKKNTDFPIDQLLYLSLFLMSIKTRLRDRLSFYLSLQSQKEKKNCKNQVLFKEKYLFIYISASGVKCGKTNFFVVVDISIKS